MFERINSPKFTVDEASTVVRMLTATFRTALDDITTADIVSVNELLTPMEATILHLEEIAKQACVERIALLNRLRIIFYPKRN
jgi:hypothetical protein